MKHIQPVTRGSRDWFKGIGMIRHQPDLVNMFDALQYFSPRPVMPDVRRIKTPAEYCYIHIFILAIISTMIGKDRAPSVFKKAVKLLQEGQLLNAPYIIKSRSTVRSEERRVG